MLVHSTGQALLVGREAVMLRWELMLLLRLLLMLMLVVLFLSLHW
jgi:hypothetical protein